MNKLLQSSVVIVTKNRKEELSVALRSVFLQNVQSEVLVIDDGSTDGTAQLVRADFPTAIVHSFQESLGYIFRRNQGARLATGEVLFSIDDDAAFSTPQVVEQTLAQFECKYTAAVAIPFINVKKDSSILQMAPDAAHVYVVDTFIGTAYAFRREVFLQMGGFREELFHQGEESDLCIRLLEAGRLVCLGNGDPIHHFESIKRDFRRMDFYGARNSVLFAWQNVPSSWLLIHLGATIVKCLLHTLKLDRFHVRLRGIIAGLRLCFKTPRTPVSLSTYRLSRRLRKCGPFPLSQIQASIVPIQ